ncbi:MAG: hypothetical protein ACFUZC_15845 [Chthoniobacteraceae bacterium]
MNRAFPVHRQHSGAFSLVELLAAVTILTVVLLLLMQITSMTSLSTNASKQKSEAALAARQVFDRIAMDWDARLRRSDLDVVYEKNAGNDALRFYSQVNGFGGIRYVTLVGYRINNNAMERGAQGTAWTDALPFVTGTAPAIADADYQSLSEDVFRMELCWQLKSTSETPGVIVATKPTKTSDIAAVVVTIAVLDKVTRAKVGTAAVESVAGVLAEAASATDGTTPLQTWTTYVQSAAFANKANTPLSIIQNLRIYQRYYYVD